MKPAPIDPFADVSKECARLARRDRALRRALAAIGAPHIRRRPGGFEGLFRIIVEQQVSVSSAQAIWARCTDGVAVSDPAAVAAVGVDGLRAFGLSTPKARYVTALADEVETGAFAFKALSAMPDEEALAALCALKGVGPWTAGIYLLFCEGRIDIWPPGDVALQYAHAAASGIEGKTEARALDAAAAGWAPLRGLAAHMLWTYYAHLRGRRPI